MLDCVELLFVACEQPTGVTYEAFLYDLSKTVESHGGKRCDPGDSWTDGTLLVGVLKVEGLNY